MMLMLTQCYAVQTVIGTLKMERDTTKAVRETHLCRVIENDVATKYHDGGAQELLGETLLALIG